MANVAIVTGGGYGIGRAACRLLAADGWKVVTFDRDAARNAETVRAIRADGFEAVAVEGDVADAGAAEAACHAAEALGTLRALVNAAAMRHPGSIVEITEAQWDETIATCLKGTFVFCKAVVPRLAAAGGGAIVNFSSTSALVHAKMIAYSAAKAAIESFTRCLGADHAADRIRVNAIVPPFTLTGMTEHYPAAALAERDDRSPSGHAARPEDVAKLVRYLVSDDAATFTGGIFGTTLPMPVR